MKSFIILAALLSLALAYTDVEYQQSFTNWMIKFKKTYSSEEFQIRFTIFKNNMDFIRDYNAKGTSTVLGLGPFADITNEEYRRIYLGTHFDGTARLAQAKAQANPVKRAPLNDTVNWVDQGAVTAIKDQGQCGSCWSFSTTGSVEGAHFLSTGNLVSLSEQNLMDCSSAEGNNGCNGGLMDDAFEYIIKTKGIDTEASYPYTAKDGRCEYKAANSGATISSYTDVTSGDEGALADAANNQPISVAIDAALDSFQHYTSGIYYEPQCSSSALDHGVLVVGYGTESDGDYWLVKNSWGTSWGENGYIQMARNQNNNCGIATMASYPTV